MSYLTVFVSVVAVQECCDPHCQSPLQCLVAKLCSHIKTNLSQQDNNVQRKNSLHCLIHHCWHTDAALFLEGPSSFNVISAKRYYSRTLCIDIFPHSCLHLSSGEEKEISWQYFSQQTSCILPAVKCQEYLTFQRNNSL